MGLLYVLLREEKQLEQEALEVAMHRQAMMTVIDIMLRPEMAVVTVALEKQMEVPEPVILGRELLQEHLVKPMESFALAAEEDTHKVMMIQKRVGQAVPGVVEPDEK